MVTVYGIKQCDTCRKALKWLAANEIHHQFHDLRADGLDADLIGEWLRQSSADILINRRSTTWRGLSDAEKQARNDVAATALLAAHPTLVKRPVFTRGGKVVAVGFKPAELLPLLGKS